MEYQNIKEIILDDKIQGFSSGKYEDGTTMNLDCRHYLKELANHFIDRYKRISSKANKADALYFTNRLKPSLEKEEMLNDIENWKN